MPSEHASVEVEQKVIKELPIPKELEPYKLQIVHEAGHMAAAIVNGRSVDGYFLKLGDKRVEWWDKPGQKPQIDHGDLGGSLWHSAGVRRSDELNRIVMAGGIAAEIAVFGHVESTRQMQLDDRTGGAFEGFVDFFEMGDTVSEDFIGKNEHLFLTVVGKICRGESLADINRLFVKKQ